VVPHAAPVRNGGLDADLIAKAVGLSPAGIGFGVHRPGVWQGGPAFLYVPVRDLVALGRAQPQQPEWDRLMELCGVDSAYLYTPGADADYHARMFSPGAGIPEDPATGSASAILAAQLWAAGALGVGETRLALLQGVEMGRPSQIALTVVCDQAGVQSVRVAGTAVRISEGCMRVPQ
jgi:trans-2,3-dihydro-3-hydroxyanthranilate isomerase